MNLVAFLLCALAAFFYAVEISLVDRYLKSVSPVVITFLFAGLIALFALPMCANGVIQKTVKLPVGREWAVIILIGFLSFIADWCHFAALTKRAGAAVLATFYILIPVFCTILRGEMPSWRMLGAWFAGAVALYLISEELKE